MRAIVECSNPDSKNGRLRHAKTSLGVLRRSSCLFLFVHPDLDWIHLGPADDLDQVGCSLGAAAHPVRAESLPVRGFAAPIAGPVAFRYPFLVSFDCMLFSTAFFYHAYRCSIFPLFRG